MDHLKNLGHYMNILRTSKYSPGCFTQQNLLPLKESYFGHYGERVVPYFMEIVLFIENAFLIVMATINSQRYGPFYKFGGL